jgi:RecB family exonuclease
MATVRAVYRRFAQEAFSGGRFGWAGVSITTLEGLVASQGAALPGCAEAGELPSGHPWKPLLERRPGLRRMLRQRLERLHVAKAAGARLDGLRAEPQALLELGWGMPEALGGARRLLQQPPPPGRRLAIGFASEPFSFGGLIGPFERALIKALQAVPLQAGDPSQAAPGPLSALRVPDVSAEARAVARDVARDPEALVLVADSQTSERIQAALRRNGIETAADGASPLASHALFSILEPLVPLFASEGRGPVEAKDLIRLLSDPVLCHAAERQKEKSLPGIDEPPASPRQIRDAIVSCRRARGTLDEWLRALRALETEAQGSLRHAQSDERSAAAQRLVSIRIALDQLLLLKQHARNRLAHMAELVADFGLASPELDAAGQAILRTLAAEGHRPVEAYREALSGTVGSGRIDVGVEVLPYAAYDGRDCELLILADVHDHGLGSMPAPDPFLHEEELRAAGIPTPREVLAERLALARWAVTRARKSLAIVTETDASGRPVTPPKGLELRFDGTGRASSYGLGFDLPELRDCQALHAGEGARDQLCRQIDAEWVRRGASLEAANARLNQIRGETLADQLERNLARFPADLLPWLGRAGLHPMAKDGLPQGFALSATRLQPFTRCLYQAFCQTVLGLEGPEEIQEELDSREVGDAVHAALERSLIGVRLVVPQAELAEARRTVLARLQSETLRAMESIASRRPGGAAGQAAVVSREGLAQRWLRHWEVYLSGRLDSVESANAELWRSVLDSEPVAAALAQLVALLGGPKMSATAREKLGKNLGAVLNRASGSAEGLMARVEEIVADLAAKYRDPVRQAMRSDPARQALSALCTEARRVMIGLEFHPRGDLEIVTLEHPFGRDQTLELALGRAPVAVRGRIDALACHRGAGNGRAPRYRVIDFKSGKHRPEASELLESLIRPQLALYALVLEAGAAPGAEPVAVDWVELDLLRLGRRVGASVSSEELRRVERVLGALLDRARDGFFPLIPHPRCCPVLEEQRAFCDFREMCRLRPESNSEPNGEEVDE